MTTSNLKWRLRYILAFFLVCSSASHAALIKYDVGFDGNAVGHMIFDTDIGGTSRQNIWNSLIDWNLSWLGVRFTSANSQAAADRLFIVNSAGTLVQDVDEELVFACLGSFCRVVDLATDDYPLFTSGNGDSLGFYTSDYVGGVVHFNNTLEFFDLTYSAPSAVTVPLPGTTWLFGSAILGLGILKRKKA